MSAAVPANLDLLVALLLFALLAGLAGGLLALVAARWRGDRDKLVEEINRRLPQTQCAQCGFPGCRPYAEAIASGEAEINRCPPGGEATVRALARLLDKDPLPLADDVENPPSGKPDMAPEMARVAVIDEDRCIGCALCLRACPVDAILGASQRMHTVIESLCTGCELCLPPCPVDCIDLRPAAETLRRPSRPVPAGQT